LPNIHFVHYADLLGDLEGEMRRIAAELDIAVPQDRWSHVVGACTFAALKQEAAAADDRMKLIWKDGANTFFNKGTNGRWRDVLTAADLALYDAAVEKTLSSDCARWLEQGGPV
jgi:aryl sulfotransferase